ncbi:MAG: UDP-N-acetylglucosamine 2-epimerase (non-hydrolyzing) [Bdellovibrionia bacterium]
MSKVINPIVVIAGTRPEVIKLATIYHSLQKQKVPVEFWMTGQHASLAKGPAEFFGLNSAVNWKVLKSGQSSNELLSKLIIKIDQEIVKKNPSAIIVQGDTTSALAGALAAFHRKIPIAHVEAGLRSGDLTSPFPEEMNRRVIDTIATWRFPPTALSRRLLIKEGHLNISEPTGNTGIDALYWARNKIRKTRHWPTHIQKLPDGMRLILSTGHRRENLGDPLKRILSALGEEVQNRPDTLLMHITHPNPVANQNAQHSLGHLQRVQTHSALNYPDFVALLDRASVVVSDSGGIQEEAPSFGLPVLITREVTERPEVLKCNGILVGTDPKRLKTALKNALLLKKSDKDFHKTPFGDGFASQRIVERILNDIKNV